MKKLKRYLHTKKQNWEFILFVLLLLSSPILNAQYTISGQITTKDGVPLQGVEVILSGNDNYIIETDSAGMYSFTVAEGLGYTITPYYNIDHLNGVDYIDMLLLRSLILGDLELNPYLYIASDFNGSNSTTTYDLVLMSQLILGVQTSFPGPSWRFIDASYEFINPQNPFLEVFPETYSVNTLTSDVEVNFIGVKVGDLNCSAVTNLSDFNIGLVHGKVFNDTSENCDWEADEPGFENWIVTLEGPSVFYATTDQDGNFSIAVPTGDYIATLNPPYPLWDFCENNIPIQVSESENITVSFPVQSQINAPVMEVDISGDRFRICEPNSYQINYCNLGSLPAEEAYVEITVDPFIEVTGASINWSSQVENVYTFDLGQVLPGACGSFHLFIEVGCNSVLGQTHCTSAHIYPDSIPVLPELWDGADLRVSGQCEEGENVIFEIENIGDDMSDPTQFIVIEDDLIMHSGLIQLAEGATEIISFPANGSTQRIIINQTEGHPSSQRQSLAIEACGENENGTISLGQILPFPLGEEDWFIAVDCRENVGAYDPNDKQGFPLGSTENHFIEKNTTLEYLIRFQNTGTDYARTVFIRDTLDTDVLDPATIRPGASSHDYEYFLSDEGVINFVFEDIMLLDSNTNEPESHGYVKFKINQIPNLPDGVIIENRAGIYFDFNAPVITNYTLHTIGFPYQAMTEADLSVYFETPCQESVPDVIATIQPGDSSVLSNEQGLALFHDLPIDQTYVLSFEKEGSLLNGLTTFDLVLTAKHILGTTPFVDPYTIIAADMNGSGSITTTDLILMRKAILNIPGPHDDFPSWRFIDPNYVFQDPQNPLGENWPETLVIDTLYPNPLESVTPEMIAIKMGDVNCSYSNFTENDPDHRSEIAPLILSSDLKKISASSYQLDIRANSFPSLIAYQFALAIPKAFEVESIQVGDLPDLSVEYFHQDHNRINTCWYNGKALDLAAGTTLFSIILKGSNSKGAIPSLQLAQQNIPTTAYTSDGTAANILFENQEREGTAELEIFPNPGNTDILIKGYVEADGPLSIELISAKGQKVMDLLPLQEREGGLTYVEVPSSLAAGVYFIKMRTEHEVITKKLLKLE